MKESKYSEEIMKEMEGLGADDLSHISFGCAFAHKMLYGEAEQDMEERDRILLEGMKEWKEYKQFSLLLKLLG